jgi:CHAD domain-containing protein
MAYRFERDETISDGVRRIAREQLEAALDGLAAPSREEVAGVVHDVRKRCKKVRGLIRLVRPAMGKQYRKVNATVRDAARELSSIRDAHALLATFDDLLAAAVPPASTPALQAVREGLVARADAATDAVAEADERVQRARALLQQALDSMERWPVSDDIADVAGGLSRTYNRGRNRLADCIDDPSDGNLHEWRKRAKYTWYHVRLLRNAAPSVLEPLADRYHDLSDAIGSDHDLAVLTEIFRAAPDEFGGADAVRDARLLIDGQRADLQRRAVRLGARLYVETREAFGVRLTGYHEAWMVHGPELEVGEIAALAPDRAAGADDGGTDAAPPDDAPEPMEEAGAGDGDGSEPVEDAAAATAADGVVPADGAAPQGDGAPAAGSPEGDLPPQPADVDGVVSGDGQASGGERLDQMSRAEIYRLAQNLDIPGRSRMNRTQLLTAVRAAGAPRNA